MLQMYSATTFKIAVSVKELFEPARLIKFIDYIKLMAIGTSL